MASGHLLLFLFPLLIAIAQGHANDGGAATPTFPLSIDERHQIWFQFCGDPDRASGDFSFHDVPRYTDVETICQAQNGTAWNIFYLEENAVELLEFQPVGKKNEFIRIRADDALKQALDKAAARDVRSLADEARYLLMKQLGLIAEDTPPYGQPPIKGGTDRKKTA